MKKQHLIFNLISAVFFSVVFYRNYLGLNVFLFSILAIIIMVYLNKPLRRTFLTDFLFVATVLSSIMFVIHNSSWNLFLNIIFLLCLSTELFYGGFRSFSNNLAESIVRLFTSQISIFLPWIKQSNYIQKNQIPSSQNKISFSKIFYLILIPFIIFILFFIIYSNASSIFFDKFELIIYYVVHFITNINLVFVFLFIFGFIIGNVLYMKTIPIGFKKIDSFTEDTLQRRRKMHYKKFKITGIRNIYYSGLVIFVLLNLLILYFNILDIIYIWFGFKWDGSFLKEFVHEGTWLLVFSVFLSAIIVMIFFKDNINFYSKNKWLKVLAVVWLLQNMIMVISVFIRNYYYIYYFGLAYKRIAVMFFLLLVFFGLFTVIIKILKLKSSFYLWRINGWAFIIVIFLSGFINWDVFIARYNFKNADRSFIDFRFMSELGYAALPYTYKSDKELDEIMKMQEQAMPFNIHHKYFYTTNIYKFKLLKKLKSFEYKYNRNNLLGWNYADYKTIKILKERGILK